MHTVNRASRLRGPIIAATLSGALLLAGCSSEPEMVSVPAVEGVRLVDAYQVLEDEGFEVEHDDYFENRGIFDRDNWVVLEQEPAGDSTVEAGADVLLRVAKIADRGTADLLPEGSPVLEEAREIADKRAADEADEAAREKSREFAANQQAESAFQDYIETLDPAMLLATQMIGEVDEFAGLVRNGISDPAKFRLGADLIHDSMSQIVSSMDGAAPPESTGRRPAYERLHAAAEDFLRAADTLASASGSTKEISLARYDEIWGPATTEWNSAISALYEGTGITPPQVTP